MGLFGGNNKNERDFVVRRPWEYNFVRLFYTGLGFILGTVFGSGCNEVLSAEEGVNLSKEGDKLVMADTVERTAVKASKPLNSVSLEVIKSAYADAVGGKEISAKELPPSKGAEQLGNDHEFG